MQYSTERGQLTETLLRMTPERHFHTALTGDTGSGKSVTAERLAYESTRAWKYRTIVLDFGQGWRKALNWPEMDGRVDIRQLYPGAVRPLRWNPLQIPGASTRCATGRCWWSCLPMPGGWARASGFHARGADPGLRPNGVIMPEEDSGMFDDIWKEKRMSQERRPNITATWKNGSTCGMMKRSG
jgi:hypothetical protein